MATPEQQARADQSEVKVKVIRNGLLIKTRNGWFSFPNWEEASSFIALVVAELSSEAIGKKA